MGPPTDALGVRLVRAAAAVVVVAVFLASTGCRPDNQTAPITLPNPQVALGPEGAAFYRAPAPAASARPGDLIWARPVKSPEGTSGFAILYWSSTVEGKLVAVSGVLFQPDLPASRRGLIFAWAHGSFGLGDDCAPSPAFFTGEGPSLTQVVLSTRAGATFVASDFEGLGTPGDHPFGVNEASGRNVLDSIRAAARFTRTDTDSVVVGHAQGGSAALFAAEMQPRYAPDVRLRGVAAVSPFSGLDRLDGQLSGGPYFGYVLMTVAGFRIAYRHLAASDTGLTEAGRDAMRQIPNECTPAVLGDYRDRPDTELGVDAVLRTADFRRALADNEPGRVAPRVPVLVIYGQLDDIIPPAQTRDLVQRYCAGAATVKVTGYPDKGHVNVLIAALDEIGAFLRDRLADRPPATSCGASGPRQ
jgi:pimeloyl-ACP methyl ester carboxylesterase